MRKMFLEVKPGEAFRFEGKLKDRYPGVFAQIDLQRSVQKLRSAGETGCYMVDPDFAWFQMPTDAEVIEVHVVGTTKNAT